MNVWPFKIEKPKNIFNKIVKEDRTTIFQRDTPYVCGLLHSGLTLATILLPDIWYAHK